MSESIFEREIKLSNSAKRFLESNINDISSYRDQLVILIDEYNDLLTQSEKLVKIGDSTQRKLRNIMQLLEDKNQEIVDKNNKLNLLNEENKNYLNQINNDLNQAVKYIHSLLPAFMKNDILEISWKFVPSSSLGGDLFGYRSIDEDNIMIFLIDVCGHGVRSALFSVSVRNTIYYMNLPNTDFYCPESVFSGLNEMYKMKEHNDLYFTIWYGVYNKKTSELNYSSSGHPPAFLINKGEIKELATANFLIGVLPVYPFKSEKITLDAETCIYIYSDGAFEILKSDNEMWTLEEMQKFLIDNRNTDDTELEILYNHVQNLHFEKNIDDDFTIMKLNFNKNSVQ